MNKDLFSLDAYGYDLPAELIAHSPASNREQSRLMIVDRATGSISEIPFHEIVHFLDSGDTLTFNDTKVIPARLFAKKATGAQIEILLVRRLKDSIWEALLKPAKKAPIGTILEIASDFQVEILNDTPSGTRILQLHHQGSFEETLHKYGQIPLPPYIARPQSQEDDKERYQTVYAKHPGSVAAPTAGLHFSTQLLERLHLKGVDTHYVTLHVGLGTFRPVQSEDIRNHQMHSEFFSISKETAEKLNQHPKGRRHICVGTTTCRALESSSQPNGIILPGDYDTQIFIYPGYSFKQVQSLLTNFHLPHSSLLMLVSAFGGYELIREAYAKAIEKKFRFFSYGDAMLII